MNEVVKALKALAVDIQKMIGDTPSMAVRLPPEEGAEVCHEMILASSIARGTRPYIERVLVQINGTYENGYYDACAVMIRRLLETLIIETFEAHKIVERIKDANGDFLPLGVLISTTLKDASWNLSRNTKQALRHLKDIGDRSAHNRRFLAHRSDIDKLQDDLRVVVQELLSIANLK